MVFLKLTRCTWSEGYSFSMNMAFISNATPVSDIEVHIGTMINAFYSLYFAP